MYIFCFFSWFEFCMFVFCLPLYEQTQQMTNWWYFFVIFQENRHWYFMQIISWREFSRENKKKYEFDICWICPLHGKCYSDFSVCNSCMYFLSWVVFDMFVFCIPLYVQIQQMTFFFFLLIFSKKWALTFYAVWLLGRSFASNDNTYFLGKHEKNFKICWIFFSRCWVLIFFCCCM